MPTERKVALVQEIRDLISGAEITIATSYQGIGVADQTDLRNSMRDADVTFRVIKNTLLLLAADTAELQQFKQLADGPTALVVGNNEPIPAARVIHEYISSHPGTPVQIRNAIVEGQLVDAAYIEGLATVPPREELLARIVGGLIGQITQLLGLLQGTTRNFAALVEARAEQMETASGN